MLDVSTRFLTGIQFSPHRIYQVTVTPPGGTPKVIELNADDQNTFKINSAPPRYTASLTISPKLGEDVSAMISVPGAKFRIWTGLDYGAGQRELIPCGVYEATSGTSPLTIGVLPLELSDLTAKLDRCKFVGPWLAAAGYRADAIEAMVLDADPTIEVVKLATGGLMPETVFTTDRVAAINQVAKDGVLDAAFDAQGRFVIQDAPVMNQRAAVWTTKTGVVSNIIDADRDQPVGRYVNTVVVEPIDEQDWPAQIVSLTNVNHPLHYLKIGKAPVVHHSSTLETPAQAYAAGVALLQQLITSTEQIRITALGNQALEYGDGLTVIHERTEIDPGLAGVYMLETATFDIATGTQNIATRTADLSEVGL